MKKNLTIAAAIIALTAMFAGCSSGTATTTATEKPDVVASEVTEETAEPEAPVAKEGTLENPWPVGYTVTITDLQSGVDIYSVTAAVVDADAQAALIAANQFNDLAPAGMKYVLMQYTVTGLNADKPVMPGVEAFSWNVADQAGALYKEAYVVTPGESISGAPDLYAGQSFTGQAAYLVPVGTTTLYFSAYGGYISL